jgi:hypothetical protein
MRMHIRGALALGILSLLGAPLHARAAPPPAEISLVTILPGRELYSAFGHTAIRVIDARGDRLYNFGLSKRAFDLAFALDMLRGKMEFTTRKLDTASTLDFYREEENRSILEQSLNLDEARKAALLKALDRAARPENRDYNYRYFSDNCATRPAAMLRELIGDASPPFAGEASKTLRSSVGEALAPQPWLDFAIGLLLGPSCDHPIPQGPIFLPKDLMGWASRASYPGPSGRSSLVSQTRTLYEAEPRGKAPPGFPPRSACILILALAVLASIPAGRIPASGKLADAARGTFDACLFFLAIVPGLAIVLFWFPAAYGEASLNLNLLWAGPLPLLALALGCKGSLRACSAQLFGLAAAIAGLFVLARGFSLQSLIPEARLLATAVAIRCAARSLQQSSSLTPTLPFKETSP